MRRDFHPLLLDRMQADPNIWLIAPDLGYKMLDACFAEFPDRCWNVGADEDLALGVAIGLADAGKTPIVYSITPFILWEPAAYIRNYLDHENANVKLLAAGRYEDGKECYGPDGPTHHAKGDQKFLSLFPNVRGLWPQSAADLPAVIDEWLKPGPAYLNLKR